MNWAQNLSSCDQLHLIIDTQFAFVLMMTIKVLNTIFLNMSKGVPDHSLTFCEISFDEIKKIWSNFLWPERKSPIEKISFINKAGKIEMKIQIWSDTPVYFAFKRASQIIAVTSVFKTAEHQWRLRGTWVSEEFRGHCVGKRLIDEVLNFLAEQKASEVWTMARVASSEFYTKCGFDHSEIITGYEYGPHIIMSTKIAIQSKFQNIVGFKS